jgi:hypothetical protein
MPWCDECNQWIEESAPPHMFSGYAYYLNYHEQCCPIHYDGMNCGFDHATDSMFTGPMSEYEPGPDGMEGP